MGMSPIRTNQQAVGSTRREFLAASTLAAGAAVATLPVARAAHTAGSDEIRLGLIGCGGRGAGAVASALQVEPAARLVAIADPFGDRMETAEKALRSRYPEQVAVNSDRRFDDFDGCRRLLDCGVDVALLAEPPHFRPMHIELCVAAGVHLFIEKPMAVDAPGVRRVLTAGETARQKQLSFISGFETRYSAGAREAVQRVHDGQIGELVHMQTTYNTGPLWHRGRAPDWTEMQFQMRNWYYFTWLSGDHLVEQHVHYNDFVSWIMRDEPPRDAWGYGGRQVRTDPKYGDIFDHHAVVYEYPNGVRVYCYTRQQPACYNENSRLVCGSKGQLRSTRGGYGIFDLAGQQVWQSAAEPNHPEITTFREMFAAMRAGQPINDSRSMAYSTMHAILGRMATHGGQLVTWDEAYASDIVLAPQSYAWNADPPVLPGDDGKYPVPIPGVTRVV